MSRNLTEEDIQKCIFLEYEDIPGDPDGITDVESNDDEPNFDNNFDDIFQRGIFLSGPVQGVFDNCKTPTSIFVKHNRAHPRQHRLPK
ncbi:hypothetical protein J6590_099638 [Homalodisca vitripennis]|nr:hypothetical protein J6590_099638 [Homalodisca vitripennis]